MPFFWLFAALSIHKGQKFDIISAAEKMTHHAAGRYRQLAESEQLCERTPRVTATDALETPWDHPPISRSLVVPAKCQWGWIATDSRPCFLPPAARDNAR